MRSARLLTYRQPKPGQLKCTLNLSNLYPAKDERKKFITRFAQFLKSDPYIREVYRLQSNRLIFDSEQLIPTKIDSRPPLLMVFGNPAPQSVKEGMFFAFEGNRKEHRFWKDILRPPKILDFVLDADLPVKERNKKRKVKLLELDYISPFRVGLCVFVSFPSGASGPWSGMDGVRKLLGSKAMRRLEIYERERVLNVVKDFLVNGGIIVTFQKNAWESLRSEKDPRYKIESAKGGKLKGRLKDMQDIPLYGLPPTRLVGPGRKVLKQLLADRLSRNAAPRMG